MAKFSKMFARTMAAVLSLTAVLGATACMGGTTDDGSAGGGNSSSIIGAEGTDQDNVTMINVDNFGGGVGKKWLEQAGARFAEMKKDEEYTAGKKGVAFSITNTTGVNITGMSGKGADLFFVEGGYAAYSSEIALGNALDLTDIIKDQTLAEYGENVTIESKIDEAYRFAFKGNDGKYYMLPHYESYSGVSYDADLFAKYGLFLAQSGKGTAHTCGLTGGTYYFTGNAADKTVGNDGKAGTDDDGMPTTLNELVAMCDYMYGVQRIKPFSVAGNHIDYCNHLIEGLWTALAGYEQRNAVVAHTGTVDYVTGVSTEELWSGITGGAKIYKPVTEKATLAGDSSDGYKAINQAGRYYAMAFVELAYHQGWFYDRYKETNYTHKDAMEAFMLSGLSGEAKIGSHIEGTYWYNEAKSYNLMEDYKSAAGTNEVKSIKWWNMPTSWGNDVVTGESNARVEAVTNTMTAGILVNGKIKADEGKVRAIKEFIKFLCTEQELQAFTACTGVSKALYNYTIDNSVLANLDPYQKGIMNIRATKPVVNQYGDNAAYKKFSNKMCYRPSAEGFHPILDGVEYNTALELFYKTYATKGYNAWKCFTQTGFEPSQWENEIYNPSRN